MRGARKEQWAKRQDTQSSYLQATAHNSFAIRLYEKLNHRYRYHDWYRIQKHS